MEVCLERLEHVRLERASVLRSPPISRSNSYYSSIVCAAPFAADQEMPVAKHTHCQLGKRTLPVGTAVCNRELVYPPHRTANVKFCWLCYVPHCDQCGICPLPREWNTIWQQLEERLDDAGIPFPSLKEQGQISQVVKLRYVDLDWRKNNDKLNEMTDALIRSREDPTAWKEELRLRTDPDAFRQSHTETVQQAAAEKAATAALPQTSPTEAAPPTSSGAVYPSPDAIGTPSGASSAAR